MTTMINPERRLSSQDTAERLFRQPVPPRLVRRTYQSDVFVTNLRVTGVDTFEVSAQLPVTHAFYGPVRPGLHDPLLLLEAIRESILLVGHLVSPVFFVFATRDASESWPAFVGVAGLVLGLSLLLLPRMKGLFVGLIWASRAGEAEPG